MKKFAIIVISLLLITAMVACAKTGDGNETTVGETTAGQTTADAQETTAKPEDTRAPEGELDDQLTLTNVKTLTLDPSVKHQEIESFGASGAWWSQVIGTGMLREKIAKLLFDPVEGIGLNAYRYNIGGGSADEGANSPAIGDVWRRTYSFETAPGEYDWSRDKGAVWFMNRAAELGVDEIVMFVNSPLERLTISGHAYADKSAAKKSNLAPENYEAFTKYVLDVAEHFKAEGLPIKYISPINEPLWGWDGAASEPWAQEGCHYENEEVIALLKIFVEEMEKREGLKGVELSAPEGVSWNWDMLALNQLIMRDPVLGKHFSGMDNHSYVTDTNAKRTFKSTFSTEFPDVHLHMSEWCEMGDDSNHRDLTMESALVLANIMQEDLTILDCSSWHYWIAVSCYEYKDGLVYTDAGGNTLDIAKRLWAMGNYSRYIDRGYTRIDCATNDMSGVKVSAYEGKNEYDEDETVVVLVNSSKDEYNIDFSGLDASKYNRISVNLTDKDHDLEETYYAEFRDGTAVTVPAEAVVTVVISNRTDA